MTRNEASRADYERDRAHRARMIKLKAHDLDRRMQSSLAGAESGLGCFALVYESRDGRLCLFEDAQGHLSAVDSSRLA